MERCSIRTGNQGRVLRLLFRLEDGTFKMNRNDKNAFKVSGFIKDEYGNNKLQVEGFWN